MIAGQRKHRIEDLQRGNALDDSQPCPILERRPGSGVIRVGSEDLPIPLQSPGSVAQLLSKVGESKCRFASLWTLTFLGNPEAQRELEILRAIELFADSLQGHRRLAVARILHQ